MIKLATAKKFVALLANFSLFFNSFVPFLLAVTPAYAQEATPVETPVIIENSPSSEPTPELIINGDLVEPTPSIEPVNVQIGALTPLVETPTPELTITPEPIITETPILIESNPSPETTPTEIRDLTPEISTTPTVTSESTSNENQNPPIITTDTTTPEPTTEITPTPIQPLTYFEKECIAVDQPIIDSSSEDWNNPSPEIFETKEKVKIGVKYIFPGENKVTVTFKCLPKDENLRTSLKIEKVKTSDLNLPNTNNVGEYAYDITTGIKDGDFAYDITLPKPENSTAEISYIEKSVEQAKSNLTVFDINKIESSKTEQQNDTVKAVNLDHFTLFIVSSGAVLSVSGSFNGVTQVTVTPNTSIEADLTVQRSGSSSNNDWVSTSWRIDSGSWNCVNTPDNTSGQSTDSESFNITAPNTVGTFDVSFRAHRDGSCGSTGVSNIFTLTDGIIVTSTPSSLTPPTFVVNPSDDYVLTSVTGVWTQTSGGSNITGLNTNEVRWGNSTGYGQSGLRFDGSGAQSFNQGSNFYLGMLTHLNWPITNAASGAKLNITLAFSKPGISSNPEFTYDFVIDETSNTSGSCPSWQQSSTPCDDKITFPNSYGTQVFTIGDIQYTLVIDGFVNAFPSGSPVSEFITEEQKNSSAFLVGHLSSVLVEKPEIRLTKKTNDQDITTAPGENLYIGDTVEWKYIIQNSGNVDLTNISIVDDQGVTIDCNGQTTLASGADMTCTASGTVSAGLYTNIATVIGTHSTGTVTANDTSWYTGINKSHLIVQKTTVPSQESTNFGISISTSNGTVFENVNGTISDSTDYDYTVSAGTYSITETVPTGWQKTGDTCQDVVVGIGETKTCTITNTKDTGTLIVKKVVNNMYGGTLLSSAFSFKINNGNDISFESDGQNDIEVNTGTYSVVENSKTGYLPTYDNCSNIQIDPGEIETCTITNNDIQPKLTVTKIVSGGTKLAGAFPIFVGSTSITSGVQNGFNVGTYTVNETPDSDYTTVISGDCASNGSITLNIGDVKECTITNTRKTGGITFIKNVTIGNALPSSWTFEVFKDGQSIGTYNHSESVTFDTGSYTVVEHGLGSYFLDSIGGSACSAGVIPGIANLIVTENEGTCQFGNSEKATITINKIVDPSTSTDKFNFTVTSTELGYTASTPTPLGNGEAQIFTDLMPGTYNIFETINSDYVVNILCNGVPGEVGSHAFMKTLSAGEDLVCTFTNTKLGTISGMKYEDYDGNLNTPGQYGVGDWTIQLWKDNVLKSSTTTSSLPVGFYNFTNLEPGNYVVKEVLSTAPGWYAISSESINVTLDPGENDTGNNFFNAQYATVTVYKEVDTDGDGDVDITNSHDWTWNIDNLNNLQTGTTASNILAGYRTISENQEPGYHVTSFKCNNDIVDSNYYGAVESQSVEVVSGQNLECVFTNTRDTGTIELMKSWSGNGGQTTLKIGTISGGSDIDSQQTGDNGAIPLSTGQNTVTTGTYFLSEANGLENYTTTPLSCFNDLNNNGTNDNEPVASVGANDSVSVAKDQHIVCNYTNTRKTGDIKFDKVVVGGSAQDSDWTFTISDQGTAKDGNTKTFDTGSYTVTESGVSNYTLTGASGVCSMDPSTKVITLNVNTEGGTCTITNTRNTGSLIAHKFEDNNNNQTQDSGENSLKDWDMNLYRGSNCNGTYLRDVDTNSSGDANFGNLSTGDYSIKETLKSGWKNTTSLCQNVTVTTNNTSTLNFGNYRLGSITVKKYTSPNSFETFNYKFNSINHTFYNNDVDRYDDLKIGTYTITEDPENGWYLKDLICNHGSVSIENRTATINVTAGLNTTCTFYNSKLGKIEGKKFNDQNGNSHDDFGELNLNSWKIFIDDNHNGIYDSGEKFDTTNGQYWFFGWYDLGIYSFNNLMPGTYQVCEETQTGWYPTSQTNCQTTTINNDGGDIDILNFANRHLGSINVTKFNDLDGNGYQDDGEANLSGWTINLTGQTSVSTDENGQVNFNNLTPGTYGLSEDLDSQPGWTQTNITCTLGSQSTNPSVECSDGDDDGICDNIDNCPSTANPDQADTDGDGIGNVCEDSTCGDGVCEFWEDCPADCGGVICANNADCAVGYECIAGRCGTTPTVTPTPTSFPTTFKFVKPVNAQVEEDIPENLKEITVNPGDTWNCYIGNQRLEPVTTISKTNNVTGDLSPGNSVEYTIDLTIADNNVNNLKVTDLLSDGFKYRLGSYKVYKDGADVTALVTEPPYHSPGVWDLTTLGELTPSNNIKLVYTADISTDQQAGTYKDLAWSIANYAYDPAKTVLAMAQPTGYVDTNFVGTEVLVVKSNQNSISAGVERTETIGQVLGASTEMPSTGAATIWLAISGLLGIAGFSLLKISKKTMLTILLTLLSFGLLVNPIKAVDNLVVRIEEPSSPTNFKEVDLKFVTLDISGGSITAKCFKKGPNDSAFSQFGADIILTAGGNSSSCALSSVINDTGSYQFYVIANSIASNTVNLDYKNSTPDTPYDYRKEKINNCDYNIHFKTGNDSGKTVKVEVYRADITNFILDDGSKIASINIGSDQEYDLANSVPNCDKEYYYVLRAFDDAGNGSGTVGDRVTVKTVFDTTTTNTTSNTTSNTIGSVSGAIPLVGSNDIPGETTDELGQESGTESEQQGTVLGTEKTESKSFITQFREYINNHKFFSILIAISFLAIINYGVKKVRGKRK